MLILEAGEKLRVGVQGGRRLLQVRLALRLLLICGRQLLRTTLCGYSWKLFCQPHCSGLVVFSCF